ncbi:efflux RND transporter periplasmic adaptor subunit [Bowmanella denitrificans]|uniref:efflux RND transporter periplasmic adaptor subunit n=1 Tax=Bowmanella denitrificans TaxID=366582 RepID=UPI000C9CCA7E|nr:efflux RND transporter periplasmic adaptor subunit [Bowmanella denitrificans]
MVNDKSALLKQLQINPEQKHEQKGLSLWHLLFAVLASAALTFWLTSFVNQDKTGPAPQISSAQQTSNADTTAAKPVTTKAPVENNSILNSSGYITARRMATVSAEVMGLITEVNVEEGMQVQQGDVLARLDSALAKTALQLSEAQVKALSARRTALDADLEEARRNLSRVNNNSFSSEAERTGAASRVQNLAASLQSASAEIEVARLQAQSQRERLDDHTIRAPFSGVVTVKNAQPGEIVAPTSAGGGFTRTGICTIVDMDSLEIEVDVNEAFIGRVSPGQQVEATLDAYPDWRIPASVIAIIPTADRAKATVQVRIRIEVKDPRILPDMGVKVAFMKA